MPSKPDATLACVRRHFRLGWWSLLVFLVLGAALEAMHGFKIQFYVDGDNETRRLMWTLAHAHGTLLGLINLAFAVSVPRVTGWTEGVRTFASRCLVVSSLLVPLGFFLGGATIQAGDPGLGILLVPVGALLLFASVFLTARASSTIAA